MKIRSIITRSAAFAACLALPITLALADTPGSATPMTKGSNKASVQHILSKIHQVNQMEIEAGELGQKKGSSDGIRLYGERLSTDHKAADQKVTATAEQENVQLVDPTPATEKEKADMKKMDDNMAKLKTLDGSAFDSLYLDTMKEGHKSTIAELTAAEKDLPASSPTKKLITELLPQLKKHEQMATDLAKNHKMPAS